MGFPNRLSSSSRTPRLFSALLPPVRRCAGFTLIEILVVIVIIAILAAIVLPAVMSSQRSGYAATSVSNLRQWGVGFGLAVAENNNEMPSDGGGQFKMGDDTAWYNRMPPQIKIQALKDGGDAIPNIRQKSVWVNPGAPVRDATGAVPFCYGFNDYLSSDEEPTMRATRVLFPAKTLLMAEKLPDGSPKVNPTNIRSYYGSKDQLDTDAESHVLFVDGHVEAVKRKVFTQPSSTNASSDDDLREAPFTWQPFVNAGM